MNWLADVFARRKGAATPAKPVVFERPVFLMGAPRSCSTLLFETLAQSSQLWSIGDESHHLIEQFPRLNPLDQADSNRLTADVLEEGLTEKVRQAFANALCDRDGNPAPPAAAVRLLEKTPKNSLRIPFFNALFPDALFIHLVRDPKENLSSIMDAWMSRRFVTYPTLDTVNGPWSLLLPPGWRDLVNSPLEEVAAAQWQAANRYILDDLRALDPQRRLTVNASELLQNPRALINKIFRFAGLSMDSRFEEYLSRPLPMSAHTFTPPKANKWHHNNAALARVWRRVAVMAAELNASLAPGTPHLDLAPPEASSVAGKPSRNDPCHCGSGLRYKACHGRLQ